MSLTAEEITAAALALPVEARAQLAERMAASLAANVPVGIREAQLAAVHQRRAEVRTGKVSMISSQQVRDEIAALLK